MDLETTYRQRLPQLQEVANALNKNLREILKDTPRIDNVAIRVKSVERFIEKAIRKNYGNPLRDIQDQIGARVVVFYKSDVEKVAEQILREFRIVEGRELEDADPARFGYQARHYICFVPPEVLVDIPSSVEFFELQVSTLFQHAWAEANHDLGYKPETKLNYEDERKIAWAAAQAWGADTILDEIWRSRS